MLQIIAPRPRLEPKIQVYKAQMRNSGLRQILRRRAAKVGIQEPPLHSFRRAFAINMLRAGVDIYSLQSLIGHTQLQVLRRYLKQTEGDLRIADALGSPVDRAGL
jgi:site-specific recombinase XerD